MEIVRPDGARQTFTFEDRGDYLESVEEIPEPHAFIANVRIGEQTYPVSFEEHEHAHGSAARDHNMRAAVIHVMADAAVSVLVIVGLLLARAFGWLWMDPLAGFIGACVIASWSLGLIRDTGAILLDMNPDRRMADNLKRSIEETAISSLISTYGDWDRVISALSSRSQQQTTRRTILPSQVSAVPIAFAPDHRSQTRQC